MISIIVYAAGDLDLVYETIRRAAETATDTSDVLVCGDAESVRVRLGSHRHADRIAWIGRPGLGRAEAVNEAIASSRGEIVGWLGAGDFHFDDTLRIVAEAAERHPGIDCFFGDALLTGPSGMPVAEFNASWRPRRGGRGLRLCPAAVFIRRRALDRAGLLDARLRFWADYELWLRLERSGAQCMQIHRLLAGRRTGTTDPAPSDFATVPGRAALEELMDVRLQTALPQPFVAACGWYGATQAMGGTAQEHPVHGVIHAARSALDARRRWGGGRPASAFEAPAIAALAGVRFVAGKGMTEFRVKIRQPLRLRRLQALRRRLFRLRHHAPRPLSPPRDASRSAVPASPPVISIVTPSFNQGHVLEATLRSVLEQGYPALDYVVQDGGSTDASVEILTRYGPRLTFWESAPDGGQSAAINRGMQRTTGEIMAYLNSDDLLLPGSLAYVARYFHAHPEVDVVYGHRILIDHDGHEIGRWILPPHDDHAIAYADYVPQETMFWRRRAWERIGARIDESFRFAMDWDLILRFREAGLTFRRLPRFLGAFRVWSDQKTLAGWLPDGRRESERLTARTFGSTPPRGTVRRELRRYLWRQWLLDKLYLAGLVRY